VFGHTESKLSFRAVFILAPSSWEEKATLGREKKEDPGMEVPNGFIWSGRESSTFGRESSPKKV